MAAARCEHCTFSSVLHSAGRFLFLCLAVNGPATHAETPMPVAFSAVLEQPARAPDRVVSYGLSASQTAALWVPPGRAAGPVPVVMLVHGGCWLREYDVTHVHPLATRLARDGYAVWVPEYRRVGEAGGGWPGSAADVATALDALASLAGQRNPQIAVSRTVIVGHSAGGHLGLWLAARDPDLVKTPVRVVAAIGLAAITDLTSYAAGDNSCEQVTERFMRASPDPDSYRLASPARLPQRVPVLLLRGSEDGIVDAEQVTAMSNARAVELAGAGHFDWIHPDTAAYGRLRDALFEVLSLSLQRGT